MISEYLLGVPASEQNNVLYRQALEAASSVLRAREAWLWEIMERRPYLLPFIDGGLALIDSKSAIRQRLIIMLAILETDPKHSTFFLQQPGQFWFLDLMGYGIRALVRTCIGVIMIAFLYGVYFLRHGTT